MASARRFGLTRRRGSDRFGIRAASKVGEDARTRIFDGCLPPGAPARLADAPFAPDPFIPDPLTPAPLAPAWPLTPAPLA